MATHVSEILDGVLSRHGIVHEVRAARMLKTTTRILIEWYGDEIRGRLSPHSIRNGELRIVCNSTAAGLALRTRQQELLQRLREEFPNEAVPERLALLYQS